MSVMERPKLVSPCSTWTPLEKLGEQPFWAVGCFPARLAHRVIGRWCGNDAVHTACGGSICLHFDYDPGLWPDGGRSYGRDVESVPQKYRLCLKCLRADETVE